MRRQVLACAFPRNMQLLLHRMLGVGFAKSISQLLSLPIEVLASNILITALIRLLPCSAASPRALMGVVRTEVSCYEHNVSSVSTECSYSVYEFLRFHSRMTVTLILEFAQLYFPVAVTLTVSGSRVEGRAVILFVSVL